LYPAGFNLACCRGGWGLGDTFSEDERTDPELVPFPQLSRKQQEYHLEVAGLTMGSIIELGYKITPQAPFVQKRKQKRGLEGLEERLLGRRFGNSLHGS